MPKILESVGVKRPQMSAFDLSHERKQTGKMKELLPCLFHEIVPGDNFKVGTEVMIRMAPMLAPVMHRVNVYVHYFFVPNRLIWDDWEGFITGGKSGTYTPLIPYVGAPNNSTNTKLADLLGIPPVNGSVNPDNIRISKLPFRAYQKIFDDYYKDPNLDTEYDDFDTLPDSELYSLRKRAWEKDYFTSALPWTQRGDEIGIPIQPQYSQEAIAIDSNDGFVYEQGGNVIVENASGRIQADDDTNITNLGIENLTTMNVNINELRRSTAIQRFLERQARGGHRYIETLLSHFGVQSSDKRMQRAEYLGGGKQPVVISEVLNTGREDTPQGTMAGHGISTGTTNEMQKTFEEHGYLMGILSVLPKSAYFQGVPREFMRQEKEDFYWPEFAQLGEQEILNAELYWDDGATNSDAEEFNQGTFGYQQRYAEYKYKQSSVHGDFRDSLDYWHLARKFSNSGRPSLNATFVRKGDAPDRIFADTTHDHLWMQVYNDVKARRPMPYFSNPRI